MSRSCPDRAAPQNCDSLRDVVRGDQRKCCAAQYESRPPAKQGFVHHDTLTLSFPRKRESRATAPSLALDPRFRGGDKLKCGTFKATLLSDPIQAVASPAGRVRADRPRLRPTRGQALTRASIDSPYSTLRLRDGLPRRVRR